MRLFNALAVRVAFYRIFPVRRRYVLTRHNRLRLRYVTASVAIAALGSAGFVGSVSPSVAYVAQGPAELIAETPVKTASASPIALPSFSSLFDGPYDFTGPLDGAVKQAEQIEADALAAIEPAGGALTPLHAEQDVPGLAPLPDLNESLEVEHVAHMPEGPREELIKIGTGETVAGVLQNVGISGTDAFGIVKAMSEHLDPREVKAGQTLSVRLEPGEAGLEFESLNMKIDPVKEVVVSKKSPNDFEAELVEKQVYLQVNAVNASIDSSLYGSAAHAGIPASVVSEMIRIYSYQVDFQRDIQQGDKFEILYETYKTADGDFARYGDVLYANLAVNGKKFPVYRYKDREGRVDYYGENGSSIKKTLMRTPVDGARMSSGFGMRRHPISGFTKMHKGVDFAVALGTPVYAAGDGTVEIAGRKGAYGNYIRVKHNNNMKTAYAHLHKIAKGIKPGQKVKQGQVIGYVGSTGRSTGPHLHYEVIVANKQVNPNSVNLPMGQQLAGRDLKHFKDHVSSVKQQYAALTEGLKYAQVDSSR